MSADRVSVVIPAWNAERWIGRAIRSVLSQEMPVFEVLVADDGSSDRTASLAGEFGDPVRVLRLPHGGAAAARNAGIEASGGEWIAFLDADDEWLPRRTAAGLERLRASPDAAVAYCDLLLVDDDGREAGRFLATKPHAGEGMVLESLLRQCFVLPSATMIRRELLSGGLRFPEDLQVAEDYELFLRLARLTPFARVRECLVRRTLRPGALSTRSAAYNRDHTISFRRLLAEHASDPDGAPGVRAALEERLATFELAHGFDRYRAGDLAAARDLLRASARRRPTLQALALRGVALGGRPLQAVLGALRGWNRSPA